MPRGPRVSSYATGYLTSVSVVFGDRSVCVCGGKDRDVAGVMHRLCFTAYCATLLLGRWPIQHSSVGLPAMCVDHRVDRETCPPLFEVGGRNVLYPYFSGEQILIMFQTVLEHPLNIIMHSKTHVMFLAARPRWEESLKHS